MSSRLTTVEIASYPKSGNTWMRNLIREILVVQGRDARNSHPPDIHQQRDALSELPFISVGNHGYRFYKSHVLNNPRGDPNAMIYIYRHPLDVLLSSINHHARVGNRWIFLGGEPKTVEEIVAGNELDFYFERFLDDLGESFWPQMLGEFSNLRAHTTFGLQQCVAHVSYEDLFHRRVEALAGILEPLGMPTPADLEAVFVTTDAKTKNSGDPFFWKSKTRTRDEFLTKEQIEIFEHRHADWLRDLGYLGAQEPDHARTGDARVGGGGA